VYFIPTSLSWLYWLLPFVFYGIRHNTNIHAPVGIRSRSAAGIGNIFPLRRTLVSCLNVLSYKWMQIRSPGRPARYTDWAIAAQVYTMWFGANREKDQFVCTLYLAHLRSVHRRPRLVWFLPSFISCSFDFPCIVTRDW
jgi:hypothetical protein